MDHFLTQVSPEIVIATARTHLKQIYAAAAEAQQAAEAYRIDRAQRGAEAPDAVQQQLREAIEATYQAMQVKLERILAEGVETMAHWYRDLSPEIQDWFWHELRMRQASLRGSAGQALWDEIVARLHTRLEDS